MSYHKWLCERTLKSLNNSIQKVVEFPKNFNILEALKASKLIFAGYTPNNELELRIDFDGDVALPGTYATKISLAFREKDGPPATYLVSFFLVPFPSCCGMTLLHGFSYNEPALSEMSRWLGKDIFEDVVLRMLAVVRNTNKRFIVNMVESRGGSARTELLDSYYTSAAIPEPVETPNINYPRFYGLFKKHAKVQEILCTNHNTGNIIHTMEVSLMASKKFKDVESDVFHEEEDEL